MVPKEENLKEMRTLPPNMLFVIICFFVPLVINCDIGAGRFIYSSHVSLKSRPMSISITITSNQILSPKTEAHVIS